VHLVGALNENIDPKFTESIIIKFLNPIHSAYENIYSAVQRNGYRFWSSATCVGFGKFALVHGTV